MNKETASIVTAGFDGFKPAAEGGRACSGTRVQLYWRLPVILTLSQIPADPCAVLALLVSLEVEFDEVNPAFMDEIGLDDAQRTVA